MTPNPIKGNSRTNKQQRSDMPRINKKDELREAIVQHLAQWFRGLDIETHQIDNSADQILALLAHSNQALIDKLLEALPEKKPTEQYETVTGAFNAGFNAALDQCRKVIEGLKP